MPYDIKAEAEFVNNLEDSSMHLRGAMDKLIPGGGRTELSNRHSAQSDHQ